MFKLSDVSANAQGQNALNTMIVKGKDGNYVRMNRDGTYQGIDYNVAGGRRYYDTAEKAYVTFSATADSYRTRTTYTSDGNISFASSSTVRGNVTKIYSPSGVELSSSTLANNSQRYSDANNATGYSNGNSR